MLEKIYAQRKLLFLFLLFVVLFSGFFFLADAQAATTKPIDTGLKTAADGGFGESRPPYTIPGILGTLIGVVLSFVGVLFLVLMVYGGLLWMTARGNEQQVEKARDLIIAAVIGLVIVLSAYAVTSFVGGQLTTAPQTT